MQVSTEGRYAVMAMVDLAMRETANRPGGLNCLADIAFRQQLSQSYLEQLFGKPRRANLVRAARGPGGGYRLARPASAIAIAAIVPAVDEPIKAPRCGIGGGGEKCQIHDLWVELGRQIALFLGGVTLADVVWGRVAGRALSPRPSEGKPSPIPPLEAVQNE